MKKRVSLKNIENCWLTYKKTRQTLFCGMETGIKVYFDPGRALRSCTYTPESPDNLFGTATQLISPLFQCRDYLDQRKKWIHVACQESLGLSCCNFLFFFGQVIKVKAVLKCQWTYTSLVFLPVRGLDYFKCTYKVTRLFLCRTIYSWSPHRLREKEEGDGWEGVDDAAEVGVSKKRKDLTRKSVSECVEMFVTLKKIACLYRLLI